MKKPPIHSDSKRSFVFMVVTIGRQALIVVMIAFSVAMVVNHFRPNGITIFAEWSPASDIKKETDKSLEMAFDQAVRLFKSGKAIFLDARPAEEYFEGHIEGAKSLPWQSFDETADEILKELPLDATIITYCDGQTCDLSLNLAKELYLIGFKNVHYLSNGWTRWIQAGLPSEKGWPESSITDGQAETRQ